MTPTISRRPSLAELLSPEELTLLEQTLDDVLREQWGPDRYEAYTQAGHLPAGLTPLPTATFTSDDLIEPRRGHTAKREGSENEPTGIIP